MAQLRFEDVSHRYSDDGPWVLQNLHLDVADGEAHALLGPSGAGKSTLLNLLSGLLCPTSGKVWLDDVDVTAMNARARNLAQVFQFPVVYEGLSVRGNLEFPLRNQGADGATIRSRVSTIAELMEITDLLDSRPGGLSAWERQKTAMARALVRPDASAVLLDEPLTAVEPNVKWRLRQSLKQVQQELGLTMIYVTHDQSEALTFAHRVSVMHEGRILQTATPEHLYTEPSHAFIGHFIGSPGMNLVPATALRLSSDDALVCGFRPEDARFSNASHSQHGPAEALDTHTRRVEEAGENSVVRGHYQQEDAGSNPLDNSIAGAADITDLRPTALREGSEHGLVLATVGEHEVHARQGLQGLQLGPAQLRVARHKLHWFHDGKRCDPPTQSPQGTDF